MKLITEEHVRYLASLSRIAVTDCECVSLAKDLSSLSEMAKILERVSCEPVPSENVRRLADLREDLTEEPFERASLLSQAFAQNGETFLVPRTVEE